MTSLRSGQVFAVIGSPRDVVEACRLFLTPGDLAASPECTAYDQRPLEKEQQSFSGPSCQQSDFQEDAQREFPPSPDDREEILEEEPRSNVHSDVGEIAAPSRAQAPVEEESHSGAHEDIGELANPLREQPPFEPDVASDPAIEASREIDADIASDLRAAGLVQQWLSTNPAGDPAFLKFAAGELARCIGLVTATSSAPNPERFDIFTPMKTVPATATGQQPLQEDDPDSDQCHALSFDEQYSRELGGMQLGRGCEKPSHGRPGRPRYGIGHKRPALAAQESNKRAPPEIRYDIDERGDTACHNVSADDEPASEPTCVPAPPHLPEDQPREQDSPPLSPDRESADEDHFGCEDGICRICNRDLAHFEASSAAKDSPPESDAACHDVSVDEEPTSVPTRVPVPLRLRIGRQGFCGCHERHRSWADLAMDTSPDHYGEITCHSSQCHFPEVHASTGRARRKRNARK